MRENKVSFIFLRCVEKAALYFVLLYMSSVVGPAHTFTKEILKAVHQLLRKFCLHSDIDLSRYICIYIKQIRDLWSRGSSNTLLKIYGDMS